MTSCSPKFNGFSPSFLAILSDAFQVNFMIDEVDIVDMDVGKLCTILQLDADFHAEGGREVDTVGFFLPCGFAILNRLAFSVISLLSLA